MFWNWFKHRRRRKLYAQPFPREWLAHLERRFPLLHHLDEQTNRRLCGDVQVFASEKHWEGCAGLEITDEMKVTIAAWACLLTINRAHDYYRHLVSILVYPTMYSVPHRDAVSGRPLRGKTWRLGETMYHGPLVVSWADVAGAGNDLRGCNNVAVHEFAHLLDMESGSANGAPPLDSGAQYRRWHEVMNAEFAGLNRRLDRGRADLLDPYAATSPAEFFAVATETFFMCGDRLAHQHPDLYEILREFYRQDPASWTP